MPRARTDITQIEADLARAVLLVRERVGSDPALEAAWAEVETFCAIALRVMRRTNPSKLRDAAMAEEIKARLSGREVIDS